MINKDELCEAEVKKNIVLAELQKPLTLPLATLNRNCKFKQEWDRLQIEWHGSPEEKKLLKNLESVRKCRANRIKRRVCGQCGGKRDSKDFMTCNMCREKCRIKYKQRKKNEH